MIFNNREVGDILGSTGEVVGSSQYRSSSSHYSANSRTARRSYQLAYLDWSYLDKTSFKKNMTLIVIRQLIDDEFKNITKLGNILWDELGRC